MTKTKENKQRKIIIGIAIMWVIFTLIACYNVFNAIADSYLHEHVYGNAAILTYSAGENQAEMICYDCTEDATKISSCYYEQSKTNGRTYTCAKCGSTYALPFLITEEEI